MEVSGQLHTPTALIPGKYSPDIHWIGGRVGTRAGLDAVENRKISQTPDALSFQPVARPYTD
jgi:hypothetical protein